MSDPVKELADALRPLVAEVERLSDQRDALAADNAKLREALREQTIYDINHVQHPFTHRMCALCDEEWKLDEPEHHAPDCLAAPKP